jgi:DNA replication and repair protein RecF
MTLRRVQVTDFRCLHRADVDLDPDFTLISGPNASGKTSLLEAVYVLGRGRSFRTRRLEPLIRSGAELMRVVGEAELPERRLTLGVESSREGLRARVGGERVASLAELAGVLPVQIIDPEIHRLIEEGPNRRRRFLDWGVFHVEHTFVEHWRCYQQALRQRNAALKARQGRMAVTPWDVELGRYGELITEARRRYVEQLAPLAASVATRLLEVELTLKFRPGWATEGDLRTALEGSLAKDQELGATQVGPHRADLAIRLQGASVRDRVSRGQQKLLAAVLLLAQIKLFPRDAGAQPTLLLDDPAAELDSAHLQALLEEVRSQPLQLVVTTLQATPAELGVFGRPGKRFEIVGGEVREV